MLTSRKRNPLTAAGLATAMTLSLCLLSGCNGARFLMGGDPQQATPNTPNQPVTTANTPAEATMLSGVATIGGKPMANATITVVDALTDTVLASGAGVIAAGGGNYKVNGYLSSATAFLDLHTDDLGRFHFPMDDHVSDVQRFVFSDGQRTISTVVTGKGKSLKSTTGNSSDVVVNEYTHAVNQYSYGLLKLAASVNESQRGDVLNALFSNLNSLTTKFEVSLSPSAAFALATASEVNGKVKDTKDLNKAIADAKLTTDLNTTVNNGIMTLADKAGSAVLTQLSNENALDFSGAGVKVEVKDGKLVLTNTTTGEVTQVDLSTPTTGTDTGTKTETSAGSSNHNNADQNITIITSASFNPTITVTRGTAPTTAIGVSQPAGSEDIAAIYTRVMKTGNSFDFNAIPTSTGTATVAGIAKPLEIVADASAPSSATLPPRFGGGTVSTVAWKGFMQLQGGGAKVASFVVYDAGTSYYLVTKYALNDAVTLSSGHSTVVNTNAVTIAAGSPAEITLVSRRGETVDTTK